MFGLSQPILTYFVYEGSDQMHLSRSWVHAVLRRQNALNKYWLSQKYWSDHSDVKRYPSLCMRCFKQYLSFLLSVWLDSRLPSGLCLFIWISMHGMFREYCLLNPSSAFTGEKVFKETILLEHIRVTCNHYFSKLSNSENEYFGIIIYNGWSRSYCIIL